MEKIRISGKLPIFCLFRDSNLGPAEVPIQFLSVFNGYADADDDDDNDMEN